MKFLLSFILLFSIQASAVPFEAQKFVTAGPSPFAVETAKKIISQGGNIVDAAVAMGLTLSVTTPYYASLGGGGFALVKFGKEEVQAIDFRETAPKATSATFFSDKSSQDGGPAVGVPGFPAGLVALHQKYGKMPWKKLFEEPIKLAERGFNVSGEWSKNTTRTQKRFDAGGIKHFFKKQDKAYLPGEVLKQPALAEALKLFRDQKERGFYQGAVANDIAQSVQKTGGVITKEDLAQYKVRWLKPMTTTLKGHTIYMLPPPSSAGVVMTTAFGLMQKLELDKRKFLSVDELHMMGEILARSFRGRSFLGDPDFHKNPISSLTGDAFIMETAKTIDPKKTTELKPLAQNELAKETETTHYSIMDADGNAVALTVTLNGNYGSGVVSNKFGVALNNEMDDFTTKPGEANMFGLVQGEGNKVEAGKRPLSSMSPTLVEKDGKIVMAVGSPGGPRIISAVIQVIYRTLVTGLDADAAIQAPRVHHQFQPHILFAEGQKLSPEILDLLRAKGHKVEESTVAKVYSVRKNQSGWLEGAFDSRGEGGAGGF